MFNTTNLNRVYFINHGDYDQVHIYFLLREFKM